MERKKQKLNTYDNKSIIMVAKVIQFAQQEQDYIYTLAPKISSGACMAQTTYTMAI